jgi:hypothetical protein
LAALPLDPGDDDAGPDGAVTAFGDDDEAGAEEAAADEEAAGADEAADEADVVATAEEAADEDDDDPPDAHPPAAATTAPAASAPPSRSKNEAEPIIAIHPFLGKHQASAPAGHKRHFLSTALCIPYDADRLATVGARLRRFT